MRGVFAIATAGLAAAATVSPAGARSLSLLVTRGATDGKTKAIVVSRGRLALPVPGRRAAASRIVVDAATSVQHVEVNLDLILQGGGRADTVMLVTSVLDPPPAPFESTLAAAVARRLPR